MLTNRSVCVSEKSSEKFLGQENETIPSMILLILVQPQILNNTSYYEIMTLKITLKIKSNAEKPGNKRNE